MFYATAISDTVGLIKNLVLPRNEAIVVFMLTIATLISITCKIDTGEVLNASTFKSGMSACVCVLGVAWLGDTFVKAHISDIQAVAGDLLHNYPWLLAVVLFFAATLLYSQAATTKALMPAALLLGVSPLTAIASFAAVSALFVLPTYPTLLAAVEMDDTGSTRIGKYVFNHAFLIPWRYRYHAVRDPRLYLWRDYAVNTAGGGPTTGPPSVALTFPARYANIPASCVL